MAGRAEAGPAVVNTLGAHIDIDTEKVRPKRPSPPQGQSKPLNASLKTPTRLSDKLSPVLHDKVLSPILPSQDEPILPVVDAVDDGSGIKMVDDDDALTAHVPTAVDLGVVRLVIPPQISFSLAVYALLLA